MPSLRALNRSLLARQGLLRRSPAPPESVVEQLVGLQAQEPGDPYVALWSRIEAFDPGTVSAQLESGALVRAGLMRSTIHLVTARDHDVLQPMMAPVMAAAFRSSWSKQLHGESLEDVLARGRPLLEAGPMTRAELTAALAPSFPAAEPAAVGQAVTYHEPLVQVPPRGLWKRSGQARWALREPAGGGDVAEVIRRYLAAFGPATMPDLRTWCRLTGLRDVVREMDLVEVDGMLDVPDAPWPDEDTPAPPRFLPYYDNIWLSHDDRSRVIGERVAATSGGGTLLVDGSTAAAWRLEEGRIVLDRPIPDAAREEVDAEADALAAFLSPGG